MRLSLALTAAFVLAAPLAAEEQPVTPAAATAPTLTFERVFASPSLDGPAPRAATLSPDGRWLTLLRNREDDRERYDLWGYDRTTGQWSMLVDSLKLGTGRELSEAEKMQRERARIGSLKGIVDYQWNTDGQSLLVPLDGDLYLARIGGDVTRLTDTTESELNPKLSPAGGYVSFVRDRRLWTAPVGQAAKPITPAETNAAVSWGEAEFVAQEEMGRLTGYWWAPGDRRVAVQRFDESGVGVVTRAAIGATGTRVFEQRYPVAGSPNALVELYVTNPDGTGRVKVDSAAIRTSIWPASTGHPMAGRCMSSGRTGCRPGWTCWRSIRDGQSRVLFTEKGSGAALDQSVRRLPVARRRFADLVVGTRRLRAPLPLCERQVDAADPGQVGRHQARRRGPESGPGVLHRHQG
jgi:dipeptidyl-peptidase-4